MIFNKSGVTDFSCCVENAANTFQIRYFQEKKYKKNKIQYLQEHLQDLQSRKEQMTFCIFFWKMRKKNEEENGCFVVVWDGMGWCFLEERAVWILNWKLPNLYFCRKIRKNVKIAFFAFYEFRVPCVNSQSLRRNSRSFLRRERENAIRQDCIRFIFSSTSWRKE